MLEENKKNEEPKAEEPKAEEAPVEELSLIHIWRCRRRG